jgi:purine-binding chemotaxis protein CheW
MEKAVKNLDILDDIQEEDEDTLKDRYLTFHLNGENYGIEIEHVTEIVGIQKITAVPDLPPFIKGVINLRGQVIPVMDIRLRFKMEPREYDERTCVIVVQLNEVSVGLVVDTVQEVRDIPEEAVSPPPQVANGKSSRYILGMGKVEDQVNILLDVNKLLFEEELKQIA